MKIEVDVKKRYFLGLMVFGLIILGIVGVVAYNVAGTGGVPSTFGHSVDEVNWAQVVPGNVSARGFCIGTNCITNWNQITGNSVIQTISGGRIFAGAGISITPPNASGDVIISSTGGASGVSRIVAGSGISVSPSTGLGDVTISASGSGGAPAGWVLVPFGNGNKATYLKEGAVLETSCTYISGSGENAIAHGQAKVVNGQIRTIAWVTGGYHDACAPKTEIATNVFTYVPLNSSWVIGNSASVYLWREGTHDWLCTANATVTSEGLSVVSMNSLTSPWVGVSTCSNSVSW